MWQFMAFSVLDLLVFSLLGLIAGTAAIFVMPGCSVLETNGRGRQLRGILAPLMTAVAGSLLAGLSMLYWWPSADGHTPPIGFAAAFFGALIALWIYATCARVLRAST